jgi:hypothetical protein
MTETETGCTPAPPDATGAEAGPAAESGLARLARLGERLQAAAAQLADPALTAGLGRAESDKVRAAAAAAQAAGTGVLQVVSTVTMARPRAGGEDGPTMARTLITAPVRDLVMLELTELGTLTRIGEAFTEAGLPEPVPDDGRMHRLQKVKLISRFFDAIDFSDRQQAEAVLALLHQALLAHRNRIGRFGRGLGELATSIQFLDLKHALASDGWHLDDSLRITPLLGPAPVELPAPDRFTDPAAGFDSAVTEALAAAQTVRTLLGGTDDTRPTALHQVLTWQLLDATRLLQDDPSCAALPEIAREAFTQLSAAAATLFRHTQQPGHLGWAAMDQSSVWIAQVTLRAWGQAALEMLEVARRHRSATLPAARQP